MWLLWCHLQSHHFKGTEAPRYHQHKEQTHPLTSSFVLWSCLVVIHVQRGHTWWRDCTQSILQSDAIGFLLFGTVHYSNDELSLCLFSAIDMKEASKYLCVHVCLCINVHHFEWMVVEYPENMISVLPVAYFLSIQQLPLEICTSRGWCDETRR